MRKTKRVLINRRLLCRMGVWALGVLSVGSAPLMAQSLPKPHMRLIEVKVQEQRVAAVEITVPDEWKTYWRSGGENGVAPQFDWSQSQNVAQVEVMFPAPQRFPDDYGDTLGYPAGIVLLPLKIMAKDPAQPVRLHLDLSYALCGMVCLPMQAQAQLVLGGLPETQRSTSVEKALKQVPVRVQGAPHISQWRMISGAQTTDIELDIVPDLQLTHLVVEGPESWRIGLPNADPKNPRRYRFSISALPSTFDPKTRLTLTLVGQKNSFEETHPLSP